MRVECYAATRPQDGRAANEDAFLIIRERIVAAAVCDGAGAAEQVAKRVSRLFRAKLGTDLFSFSLRGAVR